MRTEIIVCQRCCLCIPLRYGLIVWGYARLVLACLVLYGMSFALNRIIHTERPGRTSNIVSASLFVILVIADIILGVIFIIGCHTKNPALIKKYYYHNLCLLALLVPFCCYVVGMYIYMMIKYKMPFANFVVYLISDIVGTITYAELAMCEGSSELSLRSFFAAMYSQRVFAVCDRAKVIQIYVTLLVRSQFIKLNNGCQFRFENKVADAECSLNIEDMTGENNTDYTKTRIDDDDDVGNFVQI